MSYPAASGTWNNPPPPGTLDDQHYNRTSKDKVHSSSRGKSMKENYKRYSRSRSRSSEEYRHSPARSYSRSPSRSRSRDWQLKRSHDRHKRSRSKDYRSRKSRSRSPSHKRSSHKRRHEHKSSGHRYSRSRSRSYSRHHRKSYSRSRSRSACRYSRSRSHSWSSSSYSDRDSSLYRSERSRNYVPEVPKTQDYIRKVYSKQNEVPVQENTFKNDGSFLEMFKKMQEEKVAGEKKVETTASTTTATVVSPPEASASEVKKTLPIFGKRRGGRVLKTGLVQKLKNPNEVEEEPKDAWSVYMKEVKRYKEACCDDDSKTRPLVK